VLPVGYQSAPIASEILETEAKYTAEIFLIKLERLLFISCTRRALGKVQLRKFIVARGFFGQQDVIIDVRVLVKIEM
jgi:hypothetical protein